MPRSKDYEDMTEDERQLHDLDNLEDEYYKTQDEMDGEEDDSNDKRIRFGVRPYNSHLSQLRTQVRISARIICAFQTL